MRTGILCTLVLCGVAWHYYTLRIIQVDAMLQANEHIIQCMARQWHMEHQLEACLKNRKEFK